MTDSSTSKDTHADTSLWVQWGYEVHRLEVRPKDWARIQAGEKLSLKGQPYHYEGKAFKCAWHFNHTEPGSLTVSYCAAYSTDGGDGYVGTWKSALH
jgi:hypothetical protein